MIYTVKRWVESTEKGVGNFYKSMVTLVKIPVLSRFGANVPKAESDECYILGNGPSLKKVLQEKGEELKKKTLICVNNFPSTPEYTQFKPRHLVLLDQSFYEKRKDKRLDVVHKSFEALIKDTTWEVTLYFPMLAKGNGVEQELTAANSLLKVVYYNYTIAEGYDWFTHFIFSTGWAMPRCQNVLGASLFLMINAGYKNIYLLGADHSWSADVVVDEENFLCVRHNHFYNQGEPVKVTRLFNTMDKSKKVTIVDFFRNSMKTFEAYYVLQRYANKKGTYIWNATEGSFIDAFERKKI